MHITYLVDFIDRRKANILPYLYIGSKSNCTFKNNNIVENITGNLYYGSCKKYDYQNLVLNERIEISVLGEFEFYKSANEAEHNLHIEFDVVTDPRYFNSNNANTSNFSDPAYVSAKHSITGKVIRIEKSSPLLVSKEYVGVTAGFVTYNNGENETQCNPNNIPEGYIKGRLESSIRRGAENKLTGTTRTDLQNEVSLNSRNIFYENNPEYYIEVCKNIAEKASKTHKGIKKSAESNIKRSRKGLIMLKNRLTGECVRIDREASKSYDLTIWVNPSSLSIQAGLGSRWTTNGIINIKIKEGQSIPDGFRYGRTRKKLNEN